MQVHTLSQHLLFSTVRIKSTEKPEQKSVGTGFVFAYEPDDIPKIGARFFMVTNKHVIENAEEGSFVLYETTTKEIHS